MNNVSTRVLKILIYFYIILYYRYSFSTLIEMFLLEAVRKHTPF